MPYKSREQQLAAQARHYQEKKGSYQERDRRRKADMKAWLRDYKSNLKCEECGERRTACLTFHHTNPAEKSIDIARAIANRWSKERILTEIAKCRCLCANCHLCLHSDEIR